MWPPCEPTADRITIRRMPPSPPPQTSVADTRLPAPLDRPGKQRRAGGMILTRRIPRIALSALLLFSTLVRESTAAVAFDVAVSGGVGGGDGDSDVEVDDVSRARGPASPLPLAPPPSSLKPLLEFTEQPADVVALRDDPAQLNCGVRPLDGAAGAAGSSVDVRWYHDGRLVRPAAGDGRTASLGVLFFVSVHPRHTGVYWCRASLRRRPADAVRGGVEDDEDSSEPIGPGGPLTRQRSVRSRNATLSIAYLREEFLRLPAGVEASVGDTAVLRCSPPPGLPAPQIEWLREGKRVNVGDGRSSRLRLEGPGNLVIADVRAADGGSYVCKAENMVGIRESPPAHLRVKQHSQPRLLRVPKNKIVLVPKSTSSAAVGAVDLSQHPHHQHQHQQPAQLMLECAASGDPLPAIHWRRVVPGRAFGGDAELELEAGGDDERLTITSEERRSAVYSTLTLADVQPDDQGEYTCEAENAFGRATAVAVVSVHYGPRWVVLPGAYRVHVDGDVALACSASGNPRPDVYWTRQQTATAPATASVPAVAAAIGGSRGVGGTGGGGAGNLLFPNNTYGRLSVDALGTLHIVRVQPEDQGVYVCSAVSPLDTITTTAHVEVLGGVPFFRGSSSEYPLIKDMLASPWLLLLLSALLCLILICVAVAILLLLRKMNTKSTRSAVTQVPVAKGGDANMFNGLSHTAPGSFFPSCREKGVLYENKLNILDYPVEFDPCSRDPKRQTVPPVSLHIRQNQISGPYASTTLVTAPAANNREIEMCMNRSKLYPMTKSSQGAHELENLLHSGYSNSASSSSGTSSFEKRSGRSNASVASRAGRPGNHLVVSDGASAAVLFGQQQANEPIYSLVPDEEDSGHPSRSSFGRSGYPPQPAAGPTLTPQLSQGARRRLSD